MCPHHMYHLSRKKFMTAIRGHHFQGFSVRRCRLCHAAAYVTLCLLRGVRLLLPRLAEFLSDELDDLHAWKYRLEEVRARIHHRYVVISRTRQEYIPHRTRTSKRLGGALNIVSAIRRMLGAIACTYARHLVPAVKDPRWLHPGPEPMVLMGEGKSDLFLAQTGSRGTVVLSSNTQIKCGRRPWRSFSIA